MNDDQSMDKREQVNKTMKEQLENNKKTHDDPGWTSVPLVIACVILIIIFRTI